MTTAPRAGEPPGQPGARKKRPPRWGLRTLGFLALAIVAVLTSSELGRWTTGTLGCTVIGLGGALYCSITGIRTADLTPRREPPPEHLDPEADRWNAGGVLPPPDRAAASTDDSGPAPSTDETTPETDR